MSCSRPTEAQIDHRRSPNVVLILCWPFTLRSASRIRVPGDGLTFVPYLDQEPLSWLAHFDSALIDHRAALPSRANDVLRSTNPACTRLRRSIEDPWNQVAS